MNKSEEVCAPRVDAKILELSFTERCNLACSYCYQVERRENRAAPLSFEVATEAIRDHLTREDEFKSVMIEFIGGEVLLYWQRIKEIIEWTLENAGLWEKEFSFFLDTNGTLLPPEMKEWLTDHQHIVSVSLSLDGTPEAQDINRSDSYASIEPNLPFFSGTWPTQPAKMTISRKTVPMIFDGIVHVMRQGFQVAANVPLEDIWGGPEEKKELLRVFRGEIEKLVNLFGNHPELPLPSIIDLPIATIFSEDRDRPWCGSGRNMVAVESNGSDLPCNRYSSMSFDQTLFDRPLAPVKSRCRQCTFRAACQTCEVGNWEANGNPHDRTTYHCEFTKHQIWGTARVHTMRLGARLKELEEINPEQRAERATEMAEIHAHLVTIAAILEEFRKNKDLIDVGMESGWHDKSGQEDTSEFTSKPNWTIPMKSPHPNGAVRAPRVAVDRSEASTAGVESQGEP